MFTNEHIKTQSIINAYSHFILNQMLIRPFYAISLIVAGTTIATRCVNKACVYANTHYKECILGACAYSNFQSCLCTERFLVNYDRCTRGIICDWDGDPNTLNEPCILIACPGTFDAGFDAKEFCSGSGSESYIWSMVLANLMCSLHYGKSYQHISNRTYVHLLSHDRPHCLYHTCRIQIPIGSLGVSMLCNQRFDSNKLLPCMSLELKPETPSFQRCGIFSL
jgi:hypothetical protein